MRPSVLTTLVIPLLLYTLPLPAQSAAVPGESVLTLFLKWCKIKTSPSSSQTVSSLVTVPMSRATKLRQRTVQAVKSYVTERGAFAGNLAGSPGNHFALRETVRKGSKRMEIHISHLTTLKWRRDWWKDGIEIWVGQEIQELPRQFEGSGDVGADARKAFNVNKISYLFMDRYSASFPYRLARKVKE